MHGQSSQLCLQTFFDSEALAAVGPGPSYAGSSHRKGKGDLIRYCANNLNGKNREKIGDKNLKLTTETSYNLGSMKYFTPIK